MVLGGLRRSGVFAGDLDAPANVVKGAHNGEQRNEANEES
jgi:hypothetical protein